MFCDFKIKRESLFPKVIKSIVIECLNINIIFFNKDKIYGILYYHTLNEENSIKEKSYY